MKETNAKRRFPSVKNILFDVASLLAGAFLYAVAVNLFILPGKIVIGGLTGISTILHLLFNTPIGVLILLMNIPLMILYWHNFGLRPLGKTIVSVICISLAADVVTFIPVTNEDPIFCAVLGGVCMGTACGILFYRGFTSGGTDLLAYVLKKRFRNLSTGMLILIIDCCVILAGCIFTRNYIGIFYSVVTIFLQTKMIDFVVSAAGRSKVVFIISERYEQISDEINRTMFRGVTVLSGEGWFTKSAKPVLMTAVKSAELFRLKQIISEQDPDAFIICSDANEVLGRGFESEENKKIHKNGKNRKEESKNDGQP